MLLFSHNTRDNPQKLQNFWLLIFHSKLTPNHIMAHLLTPAPATATTVLYSRAQKSGYFSTPRVCCVGHKYHHQISSISNQDHASHPPNEDLDQQPQSRRALMGLSGALVLGFSLSYEESASAAGRPPPRPPKEKKDPNLSAVQAKVIASKKRKEAMKEEVARLREKGKTINEELQPASSQ